MFIHNEGNEYGHCTITNTNTFPTINRYRGFWVSTIRSGVEEGGIKIMQKLLRFESKRLFWSHWVNCDWQGNKKSEMACISSVKSYIWTSWTRWDEQWHSWYKSSQTEWDILKNIQNDQKNSVEYLSLSNTIGIIKYP